jgi:hypothetical protein
MACRAGLIGCGGYGRDREKLVPTSTRHKWRKRSVLSYFVLLDLLERQKQKRVVFQRFQAHEVRTSSEDE